MEITTEPELEFVGNKVKTESFASFIANDIVTTLRLDSDYYSPTFVRNELAQRDSSYPVKALGEITADLPSGDLALSDGTHDTIEKLGGYLQEGFRLITSGEVSNGFDGAGVYISQAAHDRNSRSEVIGGDLLVAVRGSTSVGVARVYPLNMPKANMNTATARVRLNRAVDTYWVATFLNSPFGRLNALRIANGVNQLNMNMEELATLPILLPSEEIQIAIGNKARKAEYLRVLATRNWDLATKKLESALGGSIRAVSLEKIVRKTLEGAEYSCISTNPAVAYARVSDELGAQYFHPRRILAQQTARQACNIDKLRNLATRVTRVANDNKTVFVGLDAVDSTSGVILLSNIGQYAGETGCTSFEPRDLMFSRLRPYLNKVSIWPDRLPAGSGSGEFLVYRPAPNIDPYFLFFVVKSQLGLNQVIDVTSGSTHPRVDADVVDEMIIPRIAELESEREIGDLVRMSHDMWYESQQLIPEIKANVEGLVKRSLDVVALLDEGKEIAAWLRDNQINN